MIKGQNKRKNYLINKKFQGKFILKFCLLLILGAVTTGAFLYLLSNNTVTTAFVNSRLSIIRTSDYILPILIGSSLVSIVLIGIATAFVIMYLSHRIAGPLYKIEKSIKEIGSGNFNLKVNLRSTDEISEIAASLNEMAGSIREHLVKLRRCVAELAAGVEKLEKDKGSLPPQAQNTLKELIAKKVELERESEYFKIG